jgi:hypothetical protein
MQENEKDYQYTHKDQILWKNKISLFRVAFLCGIIRNLFYEKQCIAITFSLIQYSFILLQLAH